MAKLVAIGDSITQGFQSLAITHTDLSYPAMIAERMGLDPDSFKLPDFRGRGGLPCSIEWLARRMEDKYGADLSAFEWLRSLHAIPDLIDEVEDYWERGNGSRPVADADYHNLAVWGFEVADAYSVDPTLCIKKIGRSKDGWFRPPSEPRLRTAYRVLNPARRDARNHDTQIKIAKRIADEDKGIEHLIVALGANNCLGTVVALEIKKTADEPPGPCSDHTLWTPAAFEAEYKRLVAEVESIGAEHVYFATVPHVTIPPITRGVMKDRGRLPVGRKYFDFYTRFFIRDKAFDPETDPHLTAKEAEEIDRHIDAYNATIQSVADQKPNWHLVDVCSVLDRLAVRRNHGRPDYPLPPALSDLSIRFFEINSSGSIKNGGLISLDGVHPTACGYAIVAQEFIDVMNDAGASIPPIDFAAVRRWDPLVSHPPRTLDDAFGMLQTLEKYFHLSRWLG